MVTVLCGEIYWPRVHQKGNNKPVPSMATTRQRPYARESGLFELLFRVLFYSSRDFRARA
jgi:hypothetical protein